MVLRSTPASTGAVSPLSEVDNGPDAPKILGAAAVQVYDDGDHLNTWMVKITDDDGFDVGHPEIKALPKPTHPRETASGDIVGAATTAVVERRQAGIQLDSNNKEHSSPDPCHLADNARLNVYCFSQSPLILSDGNCRRRREMLTFSGPFPPNPATTRRRASVSDGQLKITEKITPLNAVRSMHHKVSRSS